MWLVTACYKQATSSLRIKVNCWAWCDFTLVGLLVGVDVGVEVGVLVGSAHSLFPLFDVKLPPDLPAFP